jgi:hypothetical protein
MLSFATAWPRRSGLQRKQGISTLTDRKERNNVLNVPKHATRENSTVSNMADAPLDCLEESLFKTYEMGTSKTGWVDSHNQAEQASFQENAFADSEAC